MLERIHGIPARLQKLRAMLKARTDAAGKPKPEFKQNVPAIREEIARLEAVTLAKAERVASEAETGDTVNPGNVTS